MQTNHIGMAGGGAEGAAGFCNGKAFGSGAAHLRGSTGPRVLFTTGALMIGLLLVHKLIWSLHFWKTVPYSPALLFAFKLLPSLLPSLLCLDWPPYHSLNFFGVSTAPTALLLLLPQYGISVH